MKSAITPNSSPAMRAARRRIAFTAAAAVVVVAGGFAAASPASADSPDSQTIDFGADGYTVADQSPLGQHGWTGTAGLDFGLVQNSSYGSSGLGSTGVSLRFSNTVTSGAIGQLLSPAVTSAGESSIAADNTFTAQYTIASATGGLQDGLATEVSISYGGNRTGGDLIFRHTGAGLQIGTTWEPTTATSDDDDQWRSMQIPGPLGGGLWNANTPHTIKTVTHFVDDGPDLTDVTIDGTATATIPTWEYYTRLASGGPATVNGLLFRATTSAPSADGIGFAHIPAAPEGTAGFLFDGISYSSSHLDQAVSAPTTTPIPAADDTALPSDQKLDSSQIAHTDDKTYQLDLGSDYANQYVALFGYSSPTPFGWFLADGTGIVTFTVPSSLPDGTHSIAAYDATGALVGWVGGVTVTTAAAADPALASTGADPMPLIGAGVLLLLLGGALVLGRRRRTRRG